jgi:acyl-CoA hydrolase
VSSVEDAVAAIPDRSRVFVSQVCSVPTTLVEALDAARGRFSRVELVTAYLLEPLPVFDHPHEPFVLTSLQVCRAARAMIEAGACRIVPASLSQWPDLLSWGGPLAPDVALVQVSAPGPDGRFSLGTGTGTSIDVVRSAPLVIAEVNPQMPYTFGAGELTRDHFDLLVEVDHPLPELAPQPVGDLERTIAGHAAGDIGDGATLQFGIGAVPTAIMSLLGEHRDLGLHGGMLGDACIDLVESGAATGARKSIDPFLHVGGEVLGSRRLFEWVHRNELVMTVPARYSHGPANLARIDDFVAINSTIEIALDGAVGAEVAGGQVISGPGGQPDFALGASMSRGGVSILGLPATASQGRVSRIVRTLDPAAPVTVARYLVDRVVTEFGITRLKGLDLAQRAEALRGIAHPDFRDQLA